ncbi:tetratricopeptide repeat protein [Phenylobacterium sp.]|uniref:tetratricopeptide repeat protein n=1 Tax=Phenylobacterium sp. TaxID=1871053 RepID=UPI00121F422B|nr:tetratricopeptide repeat protein [Phenylobacterium sp.]THD58516.1 MAG: sel1 repeat family protein [Phenylobacterium sp.]
MSQGPDAPPPNGASALFTALLTLPPAALAEALAADPAEAAPLVQAAAEVGLAEGQLRLGRMLLEGAGLPQDRQAAFRWFHCAAEQGCVEAWNMLGRCLENGWGVAADFAGAAHWFARAADAGDAWAQYNLGHLNLNGQGVRRDPARAVGCYRAAADQGHPRAMNLLGRCCEQGWGVTRDPGEAARWYRLSAEGGYFRGQYNHASLLMAEGRREEARQWLEAAIAQAPAASQGLMRRVGVENWGFTDLAAPA